MNIAATSNPYRQYVSAYKEKAELPTEESSNSSSGEKIKDFACGFLGVDKAAKDSQEVTVAADQKDGFYQLGQYIKAAGTVGSMVSLFV